MQRREGEGRGKGRGEVKLISQCVKIYYIYDLYHKCIYLFVCLLLSVCGIWVKALCFDLFVAILFQ